MTWVEAWKESALSLFLPSHFLPASITKDLWDIIAQDWETVIRTWPLPLFTELCRQSNILDGLQEIIFKDPENLIRARDIAPQQAWDQLLGEWEAREFYLELERTLDAVSSYDRLVDENIFDAKSSERLHLMSLRDMEQEFEKVPPVKVWPRSPLCSVKFPRQRTVHSLNINSPDANQKRLKSFTQQYRKYREQNRDNIIDYSSDWDTVQSALSPRDYWGTYYRGENLGRSEPQLNTKPLSFPRNGTLQDIRALARDPHTPKNILQDIVSHWDLAIRLSVVAHPHADESLLTRLKTDIQPSVRAVAEARILRGGCLILPIPGELLSPGELLWLLVQNEGDFLMFGVSEEGDGSVKYSQWLNLQGQKWSDRIHLDWRPYILGEVHQWAYWRGFLMEVQKRGVDFINLALKGFGSQKCGEFPCIFLNYGGDVTGWNLGDPIRLAQMIPFL